MTTPHSEPAAGNRNGSSLNNAGENGNYWSATPNESNSNNAYNLNFNSGNADWNWNNRNNGHSVRPVTELTQVSSQGVRAHHFSVSREQLLVDLCKAYKDARKHKRGKAYQLRFEYRLEDNLVQLRDELYERRYKALPSTCFVIHDPKMREVFAAHFRDRIVHHLFYNYTYELLQRTFIADSYSCIKGRGTHYGIERLKHHIRSVSARYTKPCYVLKIDIKGYFMHINRSVLLAVCRRTMARMRKHPSHEAGKRWEDVIDFDLVDYLLECIISVNPLEHCQRLGTERDWDLLPSSKSIFYASADCGLPIGNLSSQLFSNVYMNAFDQFMKRELGCRHYGRYVDDAYVVAADKQQLALLVPRIETFLNHTLHLEVNRDKLKITDAYRGVEFLGAFIKPFRTYVSHATWHRIQCKVKYNTYSDPKQLRASVNSFLGVLSHYDSYRLRRVWFGYRSDLNAYGCFSSDWLRYCPWCLCR